MSLSIQTKTSEAKFTEAEINFPAENFIEGSDLTAQDELIKEGIVVAKTVQIRLAKMNDFTFVKNGFEYMNLSGPVIDEVRRFSADPGSERFQIGLIKAATNFVNEWVKAQGLKFTAAVPLDSTYRNEYELAKNCLRPFPFTHIDFEPIHLQNTLRAGGDDFQHCAEIVIGKMSKEEYQKLW